MGGLRLLKNLKSRGTLIIIFWIICCFISVKVNQAKALDEPSADPSTATLTIQRIDCTQTDLEDTVSLEFGFDSNNIQLRPVPPEPPDPPRACIRAFFDQDPNITGFPVFEEDSNQSQYISYFNSLLDEHRGPWFEGWQKAVFPLPDPEPDQRWEATWGIKISYPDLLPYDPNVHQLEISWNPNKLTSGLLELQIGDTRINMHEQSSITIDVVDKSIIKIAYADYTYEFNSLLGIVCVGGMTNEAEYRGNFRTFTHLGDWTYKNLKSKISNPEENIRYIFFKKHHDINGDGHNDIFIDNTINQEEKIKQSIEEWVCEKWNCTGVTKPKMALLILYLVDHGFEDGEISMDPYEGDLNNQRITSQELNEWLTSLENNLKKSGIYNYETLIFIEACYSRSFFNDLQADHRVFIASAEETKEAEISNHGIDAFSHHFWQKIGKDQCTILNAFNDLKMKFSEQNPFFWPENVSPYKEFFFDRAAFLPRDPIIIPNIITVDPNFQHIDNFGYRAKFTVYADLPINKAWAAITAPGCADEWCRFYSNPNECYHEGDDDNILSFSPDYYFFDPNTEICVYVKGEKTEVSGPYYLDPNILGDCIPISPDPNKLLDEYEPDNEPKEVREFAGELQVHSFHDSNDVDWVKFLTFPDITYDIELILLSPLALDPNIVPFQVTISKSDGIIEEIELNKIFQNYIYENTYIDNARTYMKKWKSLEDRSEILYLKIQPKEKYNSPLLYRLHIIPAIAGKNCYILSGVNIETKNKIKQGKLNLYILNENQNQISPKWIKSNLLDENYRCDTKYFYFHLQEEHTQSSFYNLYMSGQRRGPDEEIFISWDTDSIIWLDPNLYFTNMEMPVENCDRDCDGRFDPNEPYDGTSPDCGEIILHSGMNVFHYPFWATCYDKTIEIPAVNLYNIFYNPIESFYDPNITDLIKIFTFSEKENAWLCYNDQNSSEIFLNNTSGCLIYLNSTNNKIISLSDDTKFGNCLRDALYYDPNNARIELNTGLNIVGLIGYKTLFDIDPFISISDGYFNSFSASYSLAETSSDSNSMSFSSMMRYDHNQGKWENSSLFFGRATGKKFTLQPDEGYLIYMANEGDPNSLKKTIWMPHQTQKDLDYKLIVENE